MDLMHNDAADSVRSLPLCGAGLGYRIFASISRRNFSSHPARLNLARMEVLEPASALH
jgi:hypothetical protein